MKGTMIVAVLVVFIVIFQCFMVTPTRATVTCGQVDAQLTPCLSYLQGGAGPSGPCCDGVKHIEAITPSTADKQAACECLKQAAKNTPGVKEDAASSLPGKCGVTFNFPISAATDCKAIK